MTERTNRCDQIVQIASDLFVRNGYSATSVRQIADQVGCTEAALYYHFKDGKRALFREVVECNLPSLYYVLEECKGAVSIPDLIRRFGTTLSQQQPLMVEKLRWMISEFPNLDPQEQAMFHAKHKAFHDGLSELIAQFIPDKTEADRMAWMMVCTMMGYAILFLSLNMQTVVDFPPEDLIERIAQMASLQLLRLFLGVWT